MALKQIRKIRDEFEDGLVDLNKLSRQAENIEAWSEYKSFKKQKPNKDGLIDLAKINRHKQMLNSYEKHYHDMVKTTQLIDLGMPKKSNI